MVKIAEVIVNIPIINFECKCLKWYFFISVYFDIDENEASDGIQLQFDFMGRNSRKWQIRTTFIECFSRSRYIKCLWNASFVLDLTWFTWSHKDIFKVTSLYFILSRPPSGCLQYYFGQVSGRLLTFNFSADRSTHLADQRYNICIHQLPGINFKLHNQLV